MQRVGDLSDFGRRVFAGKRRAGKYAWDIVGQGRQPGDVFFASSELLETIDASFNQVAPFVCFAIVFDRGLTV